MVVASFHVLLRNSFFIVVRQWATMSSCACYICSKSCGPNKDLVFNYFFDILLVIPASRGYTTTAECLATDSCTLLKQGKTTQN